MIFDVKNLVSRIFIYQHLPVRVGAVWPKGRVYGHPLWSKDLACDATPEGMTIVAPMGVGFGMAWDTEAQIRERDFPAEKMHFRHNWSWNSGLFLQISK